MEEELGEWAKGKIATYKYPRSVKVMGVMDGLSRSGSGKILCREP